MIKKSILVSSITFVNSVLNFLFQILLGLQYGVSPASDTYFFVTCWPVFVAGFISTSLSLYATPLLSSKIVISENKFALAIKAVNVIAFISAPIFIVLCIVTLFIKNQFLPFNSSITSFSGLNLMVISAWLISYLQIIINAFSTSFNSLQMYNTAAILTSIPTVFVVIIISVQRQLPILVVMILFLIGYLLAFMVAVIRLWSLRVKIFNQAGKYTFSPNKNILRFVKNFSLPYTFLRKSLFIAIGATCFSSWALIDSYWAPRSDMGAISLLNYSQRIIVGVGSLIITGILSVSIPKLAVYFSTGAHREFYRMYRSNLRITFWLAFLSSLFFYLFHYFVIQNLSIFHFPYKSLVIQVSALTGVMLPGALVMLISIVQFRVLCCFDEFASSGSLVGFAWPFLYYFTSSKLYTEGVFGLGLAYTCSWLIFGALFLPLSYNFVNKNIKHSSREASEESSVILS